MDEMQKLLASVTDPNTKLILAIFKERLVTMEAEINRLKAMPRSDSRLDPIGGPPYSGGPSIG